MKRTIAWLMLICMLFTTVGATVACAAEPEDVEGKLALAATLSNEELYEKAKEEIAAGAQLNFYSTTSFAEKAAENFMAAYPELAGKVIYAEIDDGETYTILTNTIGSGVADSADMSLTQNGSWIQRETRRK